MSAIRNFIGKVKTMQTGKSKEMRLTYDEAFKLSVELNELLLKAVEAKPVDDGKTIITGGSLK